MQTLLITVGLGMAGIDPFAMIALLAAISTGTTRTRVVLFFITMFVFTVSVGTIGSLLGDTFTAYISDVLRVNDGPLRLYGTALIAGLLLAWLVYRWCFRILPKQQPNDKKPRFTLGQSPWHFIIAGIIYSFLCALSDPAFYAMVAFAAHTDSMLSIVSTHIVWFLLSQCLLVALLIAYFCGAHKKFAIWSQKFWKKHKNLLTKVLYVAACAVVILLLIDSSTYLLTGFYWL